MDTDALEMKARFVAVRRLWVSFVVAWLLVLLVVAWQLVTFRAPPPLRVAASLLLLAIFGALYLRTTLGHDATLRARLGWLLAMTTVLIPLGLVRPDAGVWWLTQHVVIAAGLVLPTRAAVIATLAVVAAAMSTAFAVMGRVDTMMLIELAFGAAAIAVRQLTVTLLELKAAREKLAQLAVTEERLRFSRDLHDLLGHSLTVIAIKSELAKKLLPSRVDDAQREVREVEAAARDALKQVRATVAGYRQPSLRAELDGARALLDAAGIAADIHDGAGELPAALDGVLALAVREGVTNVIRHSGAAKCSITLQRDDAAVRAMVRDDGSGGSTDGDGGSGLPGLRERLAAVNGTVLAGRDANGFSLLVEVPR